MKIKFEMTDEVTITNTTVKITAWIQGVVNGQERALLEAQALELAKKLFPDAKWAFSNFTYQPDGFTWRVQASTRIDATQNDQLDVRADEVSEAGKLTIQFHAPDASIPLHQKREAESNLRVELINKAKAEAEKLGGTISKVVFGDVETRQLNNAMRASSASYRLEAAGGADSVSLGHSEKIYLAATITVDTDRKVL